jgi:tetratricopeptide (TPR) repeat protein
MSPPNTDALERANTLLDLKRYDDAIALLGPIVASRPDDADAHILLARALLGAKRPHDALPLAEAGCVLSPTDDYPQRVRCDVLRALKRDHEALDAAWWAVHLTPDSPYGHWAVELCAVPLGDNRLAMEAARNVAHFDPGSALAHRALGYAFLANKEWSRAESEYHLGLAMLPNDPTMLNNLGKALLNQGRAEEATALFLRAGEIDGTSELYLRNTAVAARSHALGTWATRAASNTPGGRVLRVAVVVAVYVALLTLTKSALGIIAIILFTAGLVFIYFNRRRNLDDRARQAIRVDRQRRKERGGPTRPTSWPLIFRITAVAFFVIFIGGFLLDWLTR